MTLRARERVQAGKVSMEMSRKFTSDEITRIELNIYRRCCKSRLSENDVSRDFNINGIVSHSFSSFFPISRPIARERERDPTLYAAY